MKTINMTFTEREFNRLKRAKLNKKGNLNWERFFLSLIADGKKNRQNSKEAN